MAKKQFKAESKRLMDLMINSIYTHKEIFLREIISNASDAIDKLTYRMLSAGDSPDRSALQITLIPDEAAGTLTVIDNGVGMTREELESNLGTIAHNRPVHGTGRKIRTHQRDHPWFPGDSGRQA